MIVSFLRRLALAAWSLVLGACRFFLLYLCHRNIWASILNQKTSHSCARTPGSGPGGRV